MRTLARIGVLAALLAAFASAAPAQSPPSVQTRPPGDPATAIAVTVTSAEAATIESAVKSLERNRDPFLSAISAHVLELAEALAMQGNLARPWTIGPLAGSEYGTIPLEDYLLRHQDGEGLIRVQMLRNWGDRSPLTFNLSRSSFLAMLADIARGPLAQVPIVQQQQILFLGRTILDLSEQAGGVIPDSAILGALATVFRDKRVGARVAALCAHMADDGGVFDLVPRELVKEFQDKAGPGFFVPAHPTATRTIRLHYDEVLHVVRADDLVWSYLRFFSGDNSSDWAVRAAARSRAALGRKTLDHLEAQVHLQVIDAFSATLAATDDAQDVLLGDYLQDGVAHAFLKNAPVTTRVTVTPGVRRVTVGVETRKIGELQRWLDAARKKLVD